MGYSFGKKGWKLYDLESKEIFVSRDVVFCEETFSFSKTLQEELEHEKGSMAKNLVGLKIFEDPVALEHATNDGVHGLEVTTDCTQECGPAQLLSQQNTSSVERGSVIGPVSGQST